jgi:hypothetical protein
MKNLLTGTLIGAVVAAVVGGTVWSATSLMYLSGTAPVVGHLLTAADTNGGVQDGGFAQDRFLTLTWGPGQNLSTQTLPLFTTPAALPYTAVSASCVVGSAQVGGGVGNANLNLYFAPQGTALSAGTKINTTACDGNGTVSTAQPALGITTPAIPVSSNVGVVATGSGWAGPSAGSGVIQLRIQQ